MVNSQGGNTGAMETANVEYASPGIRLGSYFLEGVLIIYTLGIGWLLWALTTAGNGQTPAKKLLSLTYLTPVIEHHFD